MNATYLLPLSLCRFENSSISKGVTNHLFIYIFFLSEGIKNTCLLQGLDFVLDLEKCLALNRNFKAPSEEYPKLSPNIGCIVEASGKSYSL